MEVRASLLAQGGDPALLEAAVSRLSLEPGVTAVTWEVVDDGNGAGDADDLPPRRRPILLRWMPIHGNRRQPAADTEERS